MSSFPSVIAKIEPFVTTGRSGLLDWVITLIIISAVVTVAVYLITKVAGPPNIPDPYRWILWVVVAIALLVFIFSSLGIAL